MLWARGPRLLLSLIKVFQGPTINSQSVGNSMTHGEAPSVLRGRQQDWKELETENTS